MDVFSMVCLFDDKIFRHYLDWERENEGEFGSRKGCRKKGWKIMMSGKIVLIRSKKYKIKSLLLQFKLSQQFSFTSPQLWHPILMLPHVWPWPASSWNQMFQSFLIRWFKKFRLKQSCFCSRVQYIAKPTARVDNVQDYSSRSRMAQTARDPGPSSQAWTATNPGCSG